MKYKFVLLFFFSFSTLFAEERAWIEKSFADSIIERQKIFDKNLFPIVGFELPDNCMYIQKYDAEPFPISTKKTGGQYEIIGFKYFNPDSWPEELLKAYEKATVLYEFNNDEILVTIIINGEKTYRRYVSCL